MSADVCWMGRPGVLALLARWGPQKRRGRWRAVGKTALGSKQLEQNLQGQGRLLPGRAGDGRPGPAQGAASEKR